MEAIELIHKIVEISKKGEEYNDVFKKLKTTVNSLEFFMKNQADAYSFEFSPPDLDGQAA